MKNTDITDEQIRDLRAEAWLAADNTQVRICTIALGYGKAPCERTAESIDMARGECARAICSAQAQED